MSSEDKYLDCFNNFIKQLKIIFTDEEIKKTLDTINDYSDEKKIYNGLLFSSLIDDDSFDLLINSKIKLFSHKNQKTQEISESLFGSSFYLKNLLNNQPDDVKQIIWFNLHSIYSSIEKTKSEDIQNKSRLILIDKLIYKDEPEKQKFNISSKETKEKLQEMLDVTVNDETSSMIDDIIGSFESIINNPKGSNPLSGIMDISQKISVKYSGKISNGDIEIDKLMSSISKKVPGLDKMMNGVGDGSGNIKDMMGGMMGNMMGGKKEEPKEKILIDENFSTSNVPVGIVEEKPSNNIKIGNILKIADQFGVIPGSKKSDKTQSNSDGIPNLEGLPNLEGIAGLEGMPNLGKIMDIIQKLNTSSTPEDAENLKQEMNSFLQTDLGVDINSFNDQIEEMTKKISESTNNENNEN
jgi:hypothetical protein